MQAELSSQATSSHATSSQTWGKDYSHLKSEFIKVILTTKLKTVCQKYHKAVDTGRRSGHGRVDLLYFDLCASSSYYAQYQHHDDWMN